MSTVLTPTRARRAFVSPQLLLWSISQAAADDVSTASRGDHARELRIRALGRLIEAPGATPLWRRVCCHLMVAEIRARSDGQRARMEARISAFPCRVEVRELLSR